MRLIVLGSSSSGNGYLLDNGSECLMIECGVPFADVQRSVDYDINRIGGVLISHEHGDHAKYVGQCLSARIQVYCSAGTAKALHIADAPQVHTMDECGIYTIGNFKVQPFNVQHDAAEPFGYLIYHPECGMVLFATDTYYLHYTFDGLNNILLECNYQQEILEENIASGLVPSILRQRTMQSHMELTTCCDTLLANDLTKTNNIVLIHLSANNSNATHCQDVIHQATGKAVTIAHKGLVIENFNVTPF